MYRILLVDDEAFVLNGLKRVLPTLRSDIGCIDTAQDGHEALALMEEHPADIVFTDIKMPHMNGIEMIRMLVQRNCQCKIVILSGYDDFNYAQEAIANNIGAYLLKPIEPQKLKETLDRIIGRIEIDISHKRYVNQLECQLSSHMPILKENFLYELANGHYDEEMARFVHFQHHEGHFKIVLMSLDSYHSSANSEVFLEKEIQLALLELSNILQSDIESSIASVFNVDFFRLRHLICMFFELKPDQNNNLLETRLQSFQRNIQIHNGISVSMGVSGTFFHIEDFSIYLDQAYSALKRKIFTGENSLVFYENVVQVSTQNVYVNNSKLKSKVYQALNVQQDEHIRSLLRAAKKELCDMDHFPPEIIKTISLDLLSIFLIFAFEQELNTKDLLFNGQIPSEALLRSDTLDDIFFIIEETHMKIQNLLEGRNNSQTISIVTAIKEYVQNHISENITLEALSNVVYLTPNYICTLFKRKTGMSFKEYVLQARTQCARQLLSQNKFKIYEVASAVGYKDVTYFSKVFKKETGVYPSEYRP